MRMTLTVAIIFGTTGFAVAQFEQLPPARYGVTANPRVYPQTTPNEVLSSAIGAIESDRLSYLAAHLMDPAFVDGRVAERVPVVRPTAERELRAVRDGQRRDPQNVSPRDRLPDEPPAFDAAVDARATQLAFDLLVRDIRDTLADNPAHLKELRRFSRVADIPANGDTAEVTLPTVRGRGVYFRLVDKRWRILDGQEPAPMAPPMPGN